MIATDLQEITAEQERLEKLHSFYNTKLDKKGKLQGITINRVKLLELLMENGFYRYDVGAGRYCFVRVIDKKVQQITLTDIMDWFFRYLEEIPTCAWKIESTTEDGEKAEVEVKVGKNLLKNKFLASMGSYFSETILSRLTPEKEIKFNADTKEEKYVYYQNGFVTINKDGVFFNRDYAKLENHVWENQVLTRKYNPTREQDYTQADFYQFCYRISGQRNDRFKSLQTIIGYLLHSFYDYKLQATILTDARIGVDGEANGRTGKGVFAKGLGFMLNNQKNQDAKVYCQINGKGFDFNDKHRYAKADINTRLIHLEDVKSYLNFENLFNDITENVTVDVKNEKPFEIRSKILLSTNKSIQIKGESAEDRAIQFEFAEYYNQNFSPADDFKKWLFVDWTEDEWEKFDAFMCHSIKEFFVNEAEVLPPPTINLTRRALIEHTSQEFINFMDYYEFTDQDHNEQTTPIGNYLVPEGQDKREFAKKDLYHEFVESYPDMAKQKRFNQSKFTKWLRAYAKASDLLQPINADTDERRSNGKDFIIFRRKQP